MKEPPLLRLASGFVSRVSQFDSAFASHTRRGMDRR
jgi:hypothetical protein